MSTEREAVQALIEAVWDVRPYILSAGFTPTPVPSLRALDVALRDLVDNHGYSHGEWADFADDVLLTKKEPTPKQGTSDVIKP